MPTATEILSELEALGDERTKHMLMRNHGVREPCFGVLIRDLQPIRKRIRADHELALALYASGNYDAMYLAGLIADDGRMTREDLQRWAEQACGGALPGTTVPSVAAGGPHGWTMAARWIDSPRPLVAVAGWSTLSLLVALKPDTELNLAALKQLLARVETEIHQAPDPVRYAMNGFVIALGCYVAPLTQSALDAAERIGPVTADLGANACRIPDAADYIRKVEKRGSIGKKRKSVKC